jgi:hypothetical protein
MKYLYFAGAGWSAAWAADFLHRAFSAPPGVQRLVGLAGFGIMICIALADAAEGIAETLKNVGQNHG